MSHLAERCERARDEITIEGLFDALGWELPSRGRIRCIWPEHDDRSPSMQVYRDTNSVHCFACNKGGDVIEIARRCAGESSDSSVEDALDWLEDTFGLTKMTPAQSLKSRLRKKLAKVHARTANEPTRVDKGEVETIVRSAFAKVEAGRSPDQLAVVGDMKDYIWAEADVPGVDLTEWASWARQLIFGSYAKMLHGVEFPVPPPDIVDDRPETCRRACLWEMHRGTDYPSDWHIQLLEPCEPISILTT